MAVHNGGGFRLVADYRAVDQLVEQAAMPMPRLEELGILLGGATVFCTLDMIQGYSSQINSLGRGLEDPGHAHDSRTAF